MSPPCLLNVVVVFASLFVECGVAPPPPRRSSCVGIAERDVSGMNGRQVAIVDYDYDIMMSQYPRLVTSC